MTHDEIRATPEYKRGWDAYNPWYENNRSWPLGTSGNESNCPYQHGTIELDLWYAGANSAYGHYWMPGGLLKNFRKIPPRSAPICQTFPRQVQLSLFD